MAYNLPQVPDIKIGDTDSALKQLSGVVLRGVISDIFSQVREERRRDQATLYDGWKLSAEAALDLTTIEDVNKHQDEFKLELEKHAEGTNEHKSLTDIIKVLDTRKDAIITTNEKRAKKLGGDATTKSWKHIYDNIMKSPKVDIIDKTLVEMKKDRDFLQFDINDEIRITGKTDPLIVSNLKNLNSIILSLEQVRDIKTKENDINLSMIDLSNKIDKLGSKKEYIDEKTGALSVLNEMNDLLKENVDYTTKEQLSFLDEQRDEVNIYMSGYSALNAANALKEKGMESWAANKKLELAMNILESGMATENRSEIARGWSVLKEAITDERLHNVSESQRISKEIKSHEDSVKSKLRVLTESLTELFGKGAKSAEEAKEDIDPHYLKVLNQNLPASLQDFKFDSSADAVKYKPLIGGEIAKMVISSNLDGFNDEQKSEIKELANNVMYRTADHESADRLFEILKTGTKKFDLDFKGIFARDKKAQSIYKTLFEMYETVYLGLIEGQRKFGSEYGYELIRSGGSVSGDSKMQLDNIIFGEP